MASHEFGQTVKFPRNEHIDIHVREVILDAEDTRFPAVEIREFIKAGEVYGHGIVLPRHSVKDLLVALDQVSQ